MCPSLRATRILIAVLGLNYSSRRMASVTTVLWCLFDVSLACPPRCSFIQQVALLFLPVVRPLGVVDLPLTSWGAARSKCCSYLFLSRRCQIEFIRSVWGPSPLFFLGRGRFCGLGMTGCTREGFSHLLLVIRIVSVNMTLEPRVYQ